MKLDFVHRSDREAGVEEKRENSIFPGIGDGKFFPNLPRGHWVEHVCKFEGGDVYFVSIEQGVERENPEVYLIFYSKKYKLFYATETYDEIITHCYAKNGGAWFLTSVEATKDGLTEFFANDDDFSWDIDIFTIENLRIIDRVEAAP